MSEFLDVYICNGRVGTDKNIGEVTTIRDTLIDSFIGQPQLLEHVKDLYIEDCVRYT